MLDRKPRVLGFLRNRIRPLFDALLPLISPSSLELPLNFGIAPLISCPARRTRGFDSVLREYELGFCSTLAIAVFVKLVKLVSQSKDYAAREA